jgi:hypothetical protein
MEIIHANIGPVKQIIIKCCRENIFCEIFTILTELLRTINALLAFPFEKRLFKTGRNLDNIASLFYPDVS